MDTLKIRLASNMSKGKTLNKIRQEIRAFVQGNERGIMDTSKIRLASNGQTLNKS